MKSRVIRGLGRAAVCIAAGGLTAFGEALVKKFLEDRKELKAAAGLYKVVEGLAELDEATSEENSEEENNEE